MKYESVLFDWDGCLAQTLEVWVNAFETTLAHFDLPSDRALIGRKLGDWTGHLSMGVKPEESDEWLARFKETALVGLQSVTLYPGAKELLQQLQENSIKLALITSSHPDSLFPALERLEVAAYFETVITATDVTRHKPDAEGIDLALGKIGGSHQSAVMIGDSSKDLGAANNAGIDSVLVYPESHSDVYDIADLQALNPTYVCASFPEVEMILSS